MTFSGCVITISLTTSRAALSKRTPIRRGCRSLLLPVHSMKDDLHDDRRLHPVRAQPGQALGDGERRLRNLERIEAAAQIEEQFGVEAGADLSGEHEVVAVVVADEQRAEADARALRIGEAADDELLRGLASSSSASASSGDARTASRGAWRSRLPSLRRRARSHGSSSSSRSTRCSGAVNGSSCSSARRSSSGSSVVLWPSSQRMSKT